MQTGKATDIRLELASDLTVWRSFLAIAELGSLTRAALFLDSNQSLLSRQINALERQCGCRLFTRTGRGVELSETGARILEPVRALLHGAQQLEADIRSDLQQRAHLFEDARTGLRQLHAATGAGEQAAAALPLQGVDLPAQEGLVAVQEEGGTGQAAELGDGQERTPDRQVAGDVEPDVGGFACLHVSVFPGP